MGLLLVKWAVGCVVAWLIWDAGYKRGKGDLWEFLARNYIVLQKGSYCCSKVENKQTKIIKNGEIKMESLKRIASKSVYDFGLCFALLMPEIFPNLSCSDGFRTTAYVLLSIACFVACFGVLAFSSTHSSGKRFLSDKKLKEIDWLYRIYEPLSELAVTICLIIAGYCWLAGTYFFLGLSLRTFTYNEFEEYKEEQENGSKCN